MYTYAEDDIARCIKNKEQLKVNIEYKRTHLVEYLLELEEIRDSICLTGFKTAEYVQDSGYKKDMVFESVMDAEDINRQILGISKKLDELIKEEMYINRIWISYVRFQEIAPLHFYTINRLWCLKNSKYGIVAKELCVSKGTISTILHNSVRAIQMIAASDMPDDVILTTSKDNIRACMTSEMEEAFNSIENK